MNAIAEAHPQSVALQKRTATLELAGSGTCMPLRDLHAYDCVLIATGLSDYDFAGSLRESQIDTGSAAAGIRAKNIVRC